MKQELLLRLKEAGFPKNSASCTHCEYPGFDDEPTLSELIEACGEDFRELFLIDQKDDSLLIESRVRGKWRATMHQRDVTVWKNIMFGGSTPEEAVANLWLDLSR